ncbi:MAG: rhombotarget lipoprotein [Kangiellaceae bacterium]|nr:rhombotarget lipoprotein [Kangiellaceae bacterium]
MNIRILLILILISGLTGCVTNSHQRGVSSNLVEYLYPKGKLVSHQQDQMPLLKLPLRVGIAFIPQSRHDYKFALSEVEKQKLLSTVAERFKVDKSVADIQIIPEIYLKQGKGFITVEQVAAMYDVDVMALVSYDQVSIHEMRKSSFAYWTIVGAYVVKGESTEFQTFVDTAVFDVQSKKMLFRAPGSHSDGRNHTAIGYEKANREMRLNSFKVASDLMTNNLEKELVKFKVRAKEGKEITVEYDQNYYGGFGGGSFSWAGLIGLFLLIRFTREKK